MRKKIEGNELETISGGVHYTPDSLGSKSGTCGANGKADAYKYTNEDDLTSCVAAHYYDKQWKSIDEREAYLIQCLIDEKVITPL